ncbi:MAG: elongation factor 1-beta [Thermoplasmata archaeon]|jgi:translation elongation factor aEF-1 beta|nr:elongation factor 1-beta [Thermoplasmata archaeon]
MTKLDLIVEFKLMPDGAEVDTQKLGEAALAAVKSVAPAAKVQNIQFKPVAFGLKSVNVTILMSDAEGGPDAIEEAFNGLDGVGSASVVEMGRI